MHSTTSGIPTVDRPSYLPARRANVPLYHQIRAVLREQIHNGELKSGDQLPSEDELGRAFRVTRMTVRQAISGLVSEGLVYRRHGKGTFVGDPKVTRRFAKLTGFSEDVVARNHKPGVRTLALRKIVPPVEVARALSLKAGELVVLVHRLRLINDRPAAIQRCFLVAELVAGLESMGHEFPSLYQLLGTRFGLTLHHADQMIEVRRATGAEARLLRISARAPLVHVIRTTFLDDGRPVELAQMAYRADLFKFQTQLWRDAG
jgi:GntR family transcriptional regulator